MMNGGAQYIPAAQELTMIRINEDWVINKKGVYVFYGDQTRTFTMEDGISQIVLFSESVHPLHVVGNIDENFMGVIWPATPSMIFRWSKENGKYIF